MVRRGSKGQGEAVVRSCARSVSVLGRWVWGSNSSQETYKRPRTRNLESDHRERRGFDFGLHLGRLRGAGKRHESNTASNLFGIVLLSILAPTPPLTHTHLPPHTHTRTHTHNVFLVLFNTHTRTPPPPHTHSPIHTHAGCWPSASAPRWRATTAPPRSHWPYRTDPWRVRRGAGGGRGER